MDAAPVSPADLREALLSAGLPEPTIESSVGSTNDDARHLAVQGAPDGTVVWAEEQVSGRGRRDRHWESPAHSGIYMSTVWRLPAASDEWGWVPLIAGVALRDAMRACHVPAELKWPNDVVIGQPLRKLAGILTEVVPTDLGPCAVVGTGINVTAAPVPQAACMAEYGASLDRVTISVAVATALRDRMEQWRRDPASIAADYRRSCSTIGKAVSVQLMEETFTGIATGIDPAGHLVVQEGDGRERIVAAGDVVHATIST